MTQNLGPVQPEKAVPVKNLKRKTMGNPGASDKIKIKNLREQQLSQTNLKAIRKTQLHKIEQEENLEDDVGNENARIVGRESSTSTKKKRDSA